MSVQENNLKAIADAIREKEKTTSPIPAEDFPERIRSLSSAPEDLRHITITAYPPEGGTVSGGGMASNGMVVSVSAEPNKDDDYYFDKWEENKIALDADTVYTFPITSDRNLVAHFLQSQYIAGVDWWESRLPSSGYWSTLCYGNGKFLAVINSSSNKAAYSEDGINWTSMTLPKSEQWSSIAFGNNLFVLASKSNSDILYSSDGINWDSGNGTLYSCYGMAFGDGKFVAVSTNSYHNTMYSSDGINWTESRIPSTDEWARVAYGSGKFVATSQNSNKAAYSFDGINWEVLTLPIENSCSHVVYGDCGFLALPKKGGNAALSVDGINWAETSIPVSGYLTKNCAIYGDGKFVVLQQGSDKAAYSLDGIDWTLATMPSSEYWDAIVYGEKTFVATVLSSYKLAYSRRKGPAI